MFDALFAESGLSLDRLRALLEVAAAGSIVKAAKADPVRQSQYSRQIKELELFFHTRLIERQGKGTRLTAGGKELARISRFFMLGLSNFRRGCRAEAQTFRIGANATWTQHLLIPILCRPSLRKRESLYTTENVEEEDIERRLHDLTLDFGLVTNPALKRPLRTTVLGDWHLNLWVPKRLKWTAAKARVAYEQGEIPLAINKGLELMGIALPPRSEVHLVCEDFPQVQGALEGQEVAAFLPSFLFPENRSRFVRVDIPGITARIFHVHLACNARLLRLNPEAFRTAEWLSSCLSQQMHKSSTGVPE